MVALLAAMEVLIIMENVNVSTKKREIRKKIGILENSGFQSLRADN